MKVHQIAPMVSIVTMPIVNSYLIGDKNRWVLIDSGTPGSYGRIKRAAELCFGLEAKPSAIVLTHGHFDHAGSALALAESWGVRIYVHRLELPYLTGSSYPPLDPTAPGCFSALSRFFLSTDVNLKDHVFAIDQSAPLPGVSGWECISTPGHSPGHISLYRAKDRLLLAGDALTTMNLDTFRGIVTKRQEICGPPVPATIDWVQAKESIKLLASLRPTTIAAGHGVPIIDSADELHAFARGFAPPLNGRYVHEPVLSNESGITYLPPRR
jgi:glyoxylase-like metal-dependent hydrolase (beta-lactamase superfamily II)